MYWPVESPKQFAALRQAMPGISQKVLAEQLRELVADGIASRRPTGGAPAPVEYSPTDYGWSVVPLVENVRIWGKAYLQRRTGD